MASVRCVTELFKTAGSSTVTCNAKQNILIHLFLQRIILQVLTLASPVFEKMLSSDMKERLKAAVTCMASVAVKLPNLEAQYLVKASEQICKHLTNGSYPTAGEVLKRLSNTL